MMKKTKAFRNDGYEKVTGRAFFIDDYPDTDVLHCVPVYTDHVHARIVDIDTSSAMKSPGVTAVLTWKDIPGKLTSGQITPDLPLLAYDEIRSFGDVVAIVVAETRGQALEAAEQVVCSVEELEPLLDPEAALTEGAPLIQSDQKNNIRAHHKVRRGVAHAVVAAEERVIRQEFYTGVFEHAYLEPEGAICVPRGDGVLEILGSIQHPMSTRRFICDYLAVSLSDVEVIGHPVGGSFGGKDDTASMVAARAALAASILKRPVKMIYDREWSMRESYKRPPSKLSYQMALSKNGKITGVICRVVSDSGAYTSVTPWSTWRSAVQCCGPYNPENVHCDVYAVATNNVFAGAFRGFGSPPVNFSIEQLMDMAAEELNISPVEIRRINMVKQGSTTITGQVLDNHTVSMEQVMDRVLDEIHFDEKLKRCSYGRGEGERLYGIGFALSYRGVSLGAEGKDFCSCIINCQFDGSILLETGVWENGQGAQSAMILTLARELGVDPRRIRYRQSTTSHIPDSGTTVASRGTYIGTGAVYDAAVKLKKLIADTVAAAAGCSPDDVVFGDGGLECGGKTITWEETMAKMYNARVYPFAQGTFQAPLIHWDEETGQGIPYFTFVYSCQAAEVSVHKESGKVKVLNFTAAHDIGRTVNEAALKGQMYGGIAQGMGMALSEDFQREGGRVKSLNFNSYRIPRAMDLPEMTVMAVENPDPTSPVGCKGIGEPALEIAAPAVANAVYRATGKRQFFLPFPDFRL